MGVDVVWLMPVHPVGQVGRKGTLGSPYAVQDYEAVNPEYGNEADFARLLKTAHGLGMKVMMDVVFNHAARDSAIGQRHPEWLDTGPERVLSDWTDVVALDSRNPAASEYLTGVLERWARFGVAGFRCDVASFLPLEFWMAARRRVAAINPEALWLAESTNFAYVAERRAAGHPILSDPELYRAFDLTFDNDALPVWRAALRDKASLRRYGEMLRIQDGVLPASGGKLRFVENHDQPRIRSLLRERSRRLAWIAFQAFNCGPFLIYAGQESDPARAPSLFDRDPISWGRRELQGFLTALARLKKHRVVRNGRFVVTDASECLQAVWTSNGEALYGVFNVNGAAGTCATALPDGDYEDLLGGGTGRVRRGRIRVPKAVLIARAAGMGVPKPFYSELLDGV